MPGLRRCAAACQSGRVSLIGVGTSGSLSCLTELRLATTNASAEIAAPPTVTGSSVIRRVARTRLHGKYRAGSLSRSSTSFGIPAARPGRAGSKDGVSFVMGSAASMCCCPASCLIPG